MEGFFKNVPRSYWKPAPSFNCGRNRTSVLFKNFLKQLEVLNTVGF